MPQKLTPAQLADLLTNLPPGAKIEIKRTPTGDLIVSQTKTKTQLLEEKYSHLCGQGITISDAAKKYTVPRGAIDSWVYRSGYVSFFDESCYPKLINEAEVALCADIYRQRKATGTAGLPYFDENDLLITEVKRPISSRPGYKRNKK